MTTRRGSCGWRWMSFCGGSVCTCCRGASCASGTSGSWPTAAARSCCRCASRCWPQPPNRTRSSPRQREIFRDHSGHAHSAGGRWQLSRDSRPLTRDCALLRRQGKHHDLLFDISDRFSAGTPALKLRVLPPSLPPGETFPLATPPQTCFSPYPIPTCTHPRSHSKPITSRVQTAHFKSLYRKRSGPELTRVPERASAGAFPIQP